jgi:hypothetical protein
VAVAHRVRSYKGVYRLRLATADTST